MFIRKFIKKMRSEIFPAITWQKEIRSVWI